MISRSPPRRRARAAVELELAGHDVLGQGAQVGRPSSATARPSARPRGRRRAAPGAWGCGRRRAPSAARRSSAPPWSRAAGRRSSAPARRTRRSGRPRWRASRSSGPSASMSSRSVSSDGAQVLDRLACVRAAAVTRRVRAWAEGSRRAALAEARLRLAERRGGRLVVEPLAHDPVPVGGRAELAEHAERQGLHAPREAARRAAASGASSGPSTRSAGRRRRASPARRTRA